MTLVEVVVSLVIMSIFMVIFTTGVVQMYRSADNTEAAAVSQTQLSVTFTRLDREIRYASGLSRPGLVGADWYVELQATGTGATTCTELRLVAATGVLQQRSWVSGAAPGSGGGWAALASRVGGTAPFTVTPPDGDFGLQRLRLQLSSPSMVAGGPAKQTDITFAALNTSVTTTSDSICSEGRSAP
jgi:type II secretory pathway pseudopilin PulG